MIQQKLKTALTAAGCTLVVYESAQLANIIADQSNAAAIMGLVYEQQNMNLETAGNGVREHYAPAVVEILAQVRPEDTAEHNAALLENLLTIAKAFIYQLIRTGDFAKIAPVPTTKVPENQFDANLIGWHLEPDLLLISNVNNC
jgi:hypothetical protein